MLRDEHQTILVEQPEYGVYGYCPFGAGATVKAPNGARFSLSAIERVLK